MTVVPTVPCISRRDESVSLAAYHAFDCRQSGTDDDPSILRRTSLLNGDRYLSVFRCICVQVQVRSADSVDNNLQPPFHPYYIVDVVLSYKSSRKSSWLCRLNRFNVGR